MEIHKIYIVQKNQLIKLKKYIREIYIVMNIEDLENVKVIYQ